MQKSLAFIVLALLVLGCTAPASTPPGTPDPTPVASPPPMVTPEPVPPVAPSPEPNTAVIPPVPEPNPEPQLQAPVPPPADPFAGFEELEPGHGIGTAPGGGSGGNGPWRHRIKSASSQDGLHWTRDDGVIADQASVPDAILDTENQIRVYYVDWKNQGVTAAIDRNGSWSYYRVKLQPSGFFDGADPDVVVADGAYRIYFTKFESPGSRMASIHLAVSGNGVEFENETTAYAREDGITDPDTFQTENGWRMYLSNGPQDVLTTSNDGVRFEKESLPALTGSVSNTIAVPGGYRMYYHKTGSGGKASIYSRFSEDGLRWQEEGIRLSPTSDEQSVESPAVVRLPDGSYRMFYHSMISD